MEVQLHEGLASPSGETSWCARTRGLLHLRDMSKVPDREDQAPTRAEEAEEASEAPPEVTCVKCIRRVKCIRVKDGVWYKPFAWEYPNEATSLLGICVECQ